MKVIDLFCGAGGFSKGFEKQGFEIVLGVDNWQIACDNFKLNHKNSEIWCRDISSIEAKELPEADIIIGGTPCQEFTSLNLKKQSWRGMINVCHFFRIVHKFKPKYYIMENVIGLNKYLPEYLHKVKLKASDFGCKTGRRRLFTGQFPEPEKTEINFNPERTVIAIDNRNLKKEKPKILDLDDLSFKGTEKEIRQLQANCVPPKLAEAFAKQILKVENQVSN